MDRTARLRAYIVEDSPILRRNLIEALQELAQAQPLGTAETGIHALVHYCRKRGTNPVH